MTGKQLETARVHIAAAQNILIGAVRNDNKPVTGLPFLISQELRVLEMAIIRMRKPSR